MEKRSGKSNWVNERICRFKGHNFDLLHYRYLSGESCEKITACKRCGFAIKEAIPHVPSGIRDHKPSVEGCAEFAHCAHCGAYIKVRILEHATKVSQKYFSPSEEGCVIMAKCSRCGQAVTLGVQEHDISPASIGFFARDEICGKFAYCTNCRKYIELDVWQHEEQFVETPCGTVMKCAKCGIVRTLEDRHQYELTSRTQDGPRTYNGLVDQWETPFTNEYTCERCGAKKTESELW